MAVSSNSIFTLPVGRHYDGDGLYLNVLASGKRTWLLRLTLPDGKRTMMKIGHLPAMTLSIARGQAKKLTSEAMTGQIPGRLAKPEKAKTGGITLQKVWEAYSKAALDSDAWTPEHRTKTDGQMDKHLGASELWKRPVTDISRAEFVDHCLTIESKEVRQRVFRWLRAAVDHAVDAGVIPASQFGHTMPLTLRRPASDKGSLAGEITEIADLRKLLAASWYTDAALSVRAVHRVCALSGHRIGAVLLAKPGDVDLAESRWIVPRENMKMERGENVIIQPLSPSLLDVLKQAKERAENIGSEWLFPNASGKAPITHAAVEKHVRNLDTRKFTPHSWRSVLMTWALDNGYSREVAQAALDHARGTDSDQAYDRSTLRREVSAMLDAWAKVVA